MSEKLLDELFSHQNLYSGIEFKSPMFENISLDSVREGKLINQLSWYSGDQTAATPAEEASASNQQGGGNDLLSALQNEKNRLSSVNQMIGGSYHY